MNLLRTNFRVNLKMNSRAKMLLSMLAIAAMLLAASCPARALQVTPTNSGGGRLSSPEAQSPAKNEQEVDANDAYLHSPSVRKMGALVGLNPEQAATTFTVLNFVVLAALVGWFLIKTLPKTFRNRNAPATGPASSPRSSQ